MAAQKEITQLLMVYTKVEGRPSTPILSFCVKHYWDRGLLKSVLCPFQMFLTVAKTHPDTTKPYRAASGRADGIQT